MKYNKKRIDVICDNLSKMTSKTEACRAAGITTNTFYEWYNIYPEFKKRIDDTLNELLDKQKNIAIQSIFSQMENNWTAAAWFLERKFPGEYARRDKIDMDVNEKKIIFQIGVSTQEDMIKLIDNKDQKLLEEPDDRQGKEDN